MPIIRLLLLPFSLVFRVITTFRNIAFDLKWLKSVRFDIPVIGVGNITVGGTGKTPHVEYLIELLAPHNKLAVLSRGYKRKTRGFVEATSLSEVHEIGDEPAQIHAKFPNCIVAVDEKRVRGAHILVDKHPDLKLILLDDAFQHRAIHTGLSIVLVDFGRPIFKDFLLPAGNLRESAAGIKRAQLVLVTKVPDNTPAVIKQSWKRKLRLKDSQHLFFSGFTYASPQKVFGSGTGVLDISEIGQNKKPVILITGIANPRPLLEFLTNSGIRFTHISFPDHHAFHDSDIEKISKQFMAVAVEHPILLTTEKDAIRIRSLETIPQIIKDNLYKIPVKVKILFDEKPHFDDIITRYIDNFNA